MSHMDALNDMKRLSEAGSFLETLHNYRRRRCKDDRDRVYGMLGMQFAVQATQLRPDYVTPLETLLVEIAREQIYRTRTLDVLSYVIRGEKPSPEIPSYVPDWTVGTNYITHLINVDHQLALQNYDASGGTPADFHIEPDGQAVTKGILVDQIDVVGELWFFSTAKEFVKAKAIVDEARSLAGLTNRLPETLQAATPEEIAVWRTLCGNLSVKFGQELGQKDREWRIADPDVDFESYVRWNHILEESPGHSLADKEAFENALLANVSCRRFMITKSGRMGFVPGKSQRDDLIVVFAGGKVPYVLRGQSSVNNEESHASHLFIGDAYIDGVMNGEIVLGGSKWTSFKLL
ncbi:heterokaryon incompatibility protein [Colletotrichum tofieldiae]|nr:heterokaryon incompatibility protein [Colletotrichum tofieldiae]GKT67752.1 heterokaryon incompatibility protein [Colletotrichum tofieldiae]GKT91288.1 heterokaryon incompatibility protein [Colletotrichum tofieldiae]